MGFDVWTARKMKEKCPDISPTNTHTLCTQAPGTTVTDATATKVPQYTLFSFFTKPGFHTSAIKVVDCIPVGAHCRPWATDEELSACLWMCTHTLSVTPGCSTHPSPQINTPAPGLASMNLRCSLHLWTHGELVFVFFFFTLTLLSAKQYAALLGSWGRREHFTLHLVLL